MDTATLLGSADRLGFDRAGVCSADPFDDVRAALEDRRAKGLNDRLGFTFADPETSTDVTATVPWAERLVVGAMSYLPEAGDPGPPLAGTGRIARFSTEDHYEPLRAGLDELARLLRSDGHRARVFVDDNRLVDRAAAVRAGIGWWGKNTMVLSHGLGPWFLIGSVATDAPLDVTPPDGRGCGSCSACLPACPTGALVAPGVLDARRCIAAVLQQRGSIPLWLRSQIGDRIYGCDDCLDACPPGIRLRDSAGDRRGRVDAVAMLEMDDAALDAHVHRFYVPGRKMRFVRRNLLVVLGNSGDPAMLRHLAPYLRSPDPLLVEHALWAVGEIGGPRAAALLEEVDQDALEASGRSALQSARAAVDAAPSGK